MVVIMDSFRCCSGVEVALGDTPSSWEVEFTPLGDSPQGDSRNVVCQWCILIDQIQSRATGLETLKFRQDALQAANMDQIPQHVPNLPSK